MFPASGKWDGKDIERCVICFFFFLALLSFFRIFCGVPSDLWATFDPIPSISLGFPNTSLVSVSYHHHIPSFIHLSHIPLPHLARNPSSVFLDSFHPCLLAIVLAIRTLLSSFFVRVLQPQSSPTHVWDSSDFRP